VRRLLVACPVLALLGLAVFLWAADESKKVTKTRELLKTKVSFDWKSTAFGDVLTEIKEAVPGLVFHRDENAINLNKPITYKCKDKPLEAVLDELLGKYNWGYYVNTKKDAYEGDIYIRVGKERGYVAGEEPKNTDKPKETAKEKPKETAKVKETAKAKPPEDDADKVEKDAARKLKLAKSLIEEKAVEQGKDLLEEIIKKFPKTKAAEEAKELLKTLND
jgi:hypothetical protein